MTRRAAVLFLLLLAACGGGEEPKAVSEPGEKLYPVRGVLLTRSESANTVFMDHEAIPGFMEAMKMDYPVRGTEVAKLPPDNSRIEARLHVTDRGYWLTDVKKIP